MYNPATGKSELIFISTQQEIEIGKSAASQISKETKPYTDKQAIEHLEAIGQRVARVSDRKDIPYNFYMIDDEALNAFTVPGGHVYMHRGLFSVLDDDELACVLAHEIGHIAARHVVKRLQASLGYQLLSTIALNQYIKGHEDRRKRAGYVSYAAATAFNLVKLGYSREDEFEADDIATLYADRAGFDPHGMASALTKLKQRKEKGLPVPYILRSHPYLDDRIRRVEDKLTRSEY